MTQPTPDRQADTLERVLSATPSATTEPRDIVAARIENECVIAEARGRARDFPAIKKALADMLRDFPDSAEEMLYERPVGRDDTTGAETTATGLSIRAAEALAEQYGFCRIACDISPMDQDRYIVRASFTDYLNCRVWADTGVISQTYKTKRGQVARHADDRFFGTVVKAEVSRRIREVVLRSVSAPLKKWFEAEVRKTLRQHLTPERVAQIVESFATIGVSAGQLEQHLERSRDEWTIRERSRLAMAWAQIQDGADPGEIFGTPTDGPDPEEQTSEAKPET